MTRAISARCAPRSPRRRSTETPRPSRRGARSLVRCRSPTRSRRATTSAAAARSSRRAGRAPSPTSGRVRTPTDPAFRRRARADAPGDLRAARPTRARSTSVPVSETAPESELPTGRSRCSPRGHLPVISVEQVARVDFRPDLQRATGRGSGRARRARSGSGHAAGASGPSPSWSARWPAGRAVSARGTAAPIAGALRREIRGRVNAITMACPGELANEALEPRGKQGSCSLLDPREPPLCQLVHRGSRPLSGGYHPRVGGEQRRSRCGYRRRRRPRGLQSPVDVGGEVAYSDS